MTAREQHVSSSPENRHVADRNAATGHRSKTRIAPARRTERGRQTHGWLAPTELPLLADGDDALRVDLWETVCNDLRLGQAAVSFDVEDVDFA